MNALMFGIIVCVWLTEPVCGKCLAEHCHQSELTQCMEHVKPIMQNATIGFAANAEQLNTVCKLFNQGMECIDRFVAKCFQESQRILFKENMAGVEEVMKRLCTDGEYRKEYLQHADCFRSVAPQYEECGGAFRTSVGTINQNRATETQDKLSQMCGALHRFLECAYGLTSQHCGENGKSASEFLRTYTEKAVGSLITSTCRKFPAGNKLTNSNNRVVEIDEEDGLREVSLQDDLTTVLISTTTTMRPTRPSRGGGGQGKGSKKGEGRSRSKATPPHRGAGVTPAGSLQGTAASGTRGGAAGVQIVTSGFKVFLLIWCALWHLRIFSSWPFGHVFC
ncbi:uncharacterized protein LOC129588111 isoform X2 [Paramacrobiotus metropolitanus]|uniref:uncharacterized protein LOC129588089 n=1 Tax=Paramacrobiotus metropolitanus TaxID=2943436 RepID=UPI0024458C72|nr:uncharacterized protein LOC129588089 [Paramacrobiotus metropolitanus]XP_055338163.1 uncharacterized protein LOC129588111 isoform X2 [Paramacrobiotus metropolitanus]